MDGSTANLLRRFLQRAPDALTDEELLTLLLHAGTGAEEPRTLAARLIGQFGSLSARPSPPRRRSWPAWRGWMHRGRCCCGS